MVPGSNHVKAIPGYEIPTTINPQRMTSGSAAQICGSCHSRGKDKKRRPSISFGVYDIKRSLKPLCAL